MIKNPNPSQEPPKLQQSVIIRHAESAGTWALVPRQFLCELFWQAVLGENTLNIKLLLRKTPKELNKRQKPLSKYFSGSF